MLCWEPSRKFFCEFETYFCLFAKVSRKWDIIDIMNMNHYHCIHCSLLRATTSCRPGVRQENGTAHLPFRGRSQASKSEALREPNAKALAFAFPLMRPLLMAGRIGLFSRKFRESSAKGVAHTGPQ